MRKQLTAAERLVVAADYEPSQEDLKIPGWQRWLQEKLSKLTVDIAGRGIYFKVNSSERALGNRLLHHIKSSGLRIFADLKLFDIPNTLSTDGVFLNEFKPEIVTVSCLAGVKSMAALKEKMPDSEILGITVLTSLTEDEVFRMFGCSILIAVRRAAKMADEAGIDGLVCSPSEATFLREEFGDRFSLNTPAIRPRWSAVKVDDQNPARTTTPAKAIEAGADRIIVGRPITTDPNPGMAVTRTIEEIQSTLDDLG